MKKVISIILVAIMATMIAVAAANVIKITTSCGVIVYMEYTAQHTALDVINDSYILDDQYCGNPTSGKVLEVIYP